MKRVLIASVIMVLSITSLSAQKNFVFSVSPGMTVQSSSFGFQSGRFIPSIGMDVAFMTVDGEYTTTGTWGYDSWTNHYEGNGNAFLFMPHLGFRYLLTSRAARPYLTLSATKCFPVVNGKYTSEYVYYSSSGGVLGSYSTTEELDDELKDQIQNILGFWYFTAGFGGEYRFSRSFGVIGESGFRLAFTSSDEEGEGSPGGGGGSSAYADEWKLKMAAVVGITYAKIGLCYYFGPTDDK